MLFKLTLNLLLTLETKIHIFFQKVNKYVTFCKIRHGYFMQITALSA
uniref:Uncharacterized protein n=1 Tax=Anguilla anguilla TaxID=7936 RepID=A0A0E9QCS0_ANGAN